MQQKLTIVIFLFSVLLINLNLYGAYIVDLGAPAQVRWTELVNQYDKESLRHYAASLDEAMLDTSFILKFDWVRKRIMEYGWKESMNANPLWFQDLQEEIRGLAKALQTRLDGESLRGFREEDLFLLNIGYDFSTYCTSGVFQTEDGPILFRNLDWEGEEFKKFTIETNFQRQGQTVFRSIQFLGQVGVLTAMKPYAYGVALNYRKTPNTGSLGLAILNNVFQFVFKDGWSASILLRYTLEHESNFAKAKSKLETTELMGPSYLIMQEWKMGKVL